MGREPASRGHEILAHTADAGLRARAPDLPGLFEEAAAALAELAADVNPAEPADEVDLALEATDLVGLACAWLNELISLADACSAAIATARVASVVVEPVPTEAGAPGGRSAEERAALRATVALVPRGPRARPRLDVKSATYHGLVVARDARGGWTLTAYVDV